MLEVLQMDLHFFQLPLKKQTNKQPLSLDRNSTILIKDMPRLDTGILLNT